MHGCFGCRTLSGRAGVIVCCKNLAVVWFREFISDSDHDPKESFFDAGLSVPQINQFITDACPLQGQLVSARVISKDNKQDNTRCRNQV